MDNLGYGRSPPQIVLRSHYSLAAYHEVGWLKRDGLRDFVDVSYVLIIPGLILTLKGARQHLNCKQIVSQHAAAGEFGIQICCHGLMTD